MNQNLHSFAVSLLFLLLIVSSESIRPLSTKQPTSISQLGEEIKVTNGVVHAEDDTSINELMGMEVCENGDEDCIERRMASEAHLDYIYTQHHKP